MVGRLGRSRVLRGWSLGDLGLPGVKVWGGFVEVTVLGEQGRGVWLKPPHAVDVDVGITRPAGAAFTSPEELPASGQRPRLPYSASPLARVLLSWK